MRTNRRRAAFACALAAALLCACGDLDPVGIRVSINDEVIRNNGTYDFGSCLTDGQGSASLAGELRIEAYGTAPVIVGKIALSGSNADQYAMQDIGKNVEIAAQQNVSATLTFDPTLHGSMSALLVISNNDKRNGTFAIHLVGRGAYQPGALDVEAFGTGGKVLTQIGTLDSYAVASVVQPDGRIVVVGSEGSTTDTNMAVARYSATGALETAFFGHGGVAYDNNASGAGIDYAGGRDSALCAALQPDKKIVVGGTFTVSGTDIDFGLVRLTENGILDTAFGTGGKAIAHIGAKEDMIVAVFVLGDGDILAIGNTNVSSTATADYRMVIARFRPNGTLDTSFGTNNGWTVLPDASICYGAAMDLYGRVLLEGYTAGKFRVVRCNTDGSIDKDLTQDSGNGVAFGTRILVQDDGRVLLAGFTVVSSTVKPILLRFDSELTGLEFMRTYSEIGASTCYGIATVQGRSGKIYLAGYIADSGNDSVFLARINADGSLDEAGFGTNGYSIVSQGSSNTGYLMDVRLQSNGLVVVATNGRNSNSRYNFALYRFEP